MDLDDFDKLIERRNTDSTKWDKYKDRDIIPLWVADMDFRSPPALLDALHKRIEHGVFGYTQAPAELVATVLDMLEREYGWTVQPDWLIWLPGVVTGFNIACRIAGEDNDAVLTATPVYHPFLAAPENNQRRLIQVPMLRDASWHLDFERLEDAVTPDTRMFLLCSPHNPVGRVYTREELLTLAELCDKHDILICSDEIHCQLLLDQDKRHIPTASLDPAIAARTITLMAPSKTFNLAGLLCSFAIISNARLRERFLAAKSGIVPHVGTLNYTAALAAYRDCDDWRRALLDYLSGNRDLVEQAVATMPGVAMTHVEATYLAWINVTATGLDNPVGFFEEAGLGFSDGSVFGGPGFIRFNFGCPRATLSKALARMDTALQRHTQLAES